MAIYWAVWSALAVIISKGEGVFGSTQEPLCFDCAGVADLNHCTTVSECSHTDQCYTKEVIHSNGSRWYSMGCKPRDECNALPIRPIPFRERNVDVEIELCDHCCEGDLCNSRICLTNNTEVVRCLECENVDNPRECRNVRTCQRGEICFSKEMTNGGSPVTYSMGCLSKAICVFLNPPLVGKRESRSRAGRSSAICQQCCATDTCNIDLCSTSEQVIFSTDLPTPTFSSVDTTPTDLSTATFSSVDTTPTDLPIATFSSVDTTLIPTPKQDTAKDCWDLKIQHGVTQSGTYTITAPNGTLINVRCDMDTDGGGWTFVQRRLNDITDFNRTWEAYKSFFGNLTGSFWMGNDLMSEYTNTDQTLRVDLCDKMGQHVYAIYRLFRVADESDQYRLHVEGYSGTAGDALIVGINSEWRHNGRQFSTIDHPTNYGIYCPRTYASGWWFNRCIAANLNGIHTAPGATHTIEGIQWATWHGWMPFEQGEMKIRPMNATSNAHSDNFLCDRS